MRNYIKYLRLISQASNPEIERDLFKRVAVPQVCRSEQAEFAAAVGRHSAARRYAFISSTSSSPQWSAGWSVGLPSARTRR